MTVSDNPIAAETFGDFSKNLDQKRLIVSKKIAKSVLHNPG